MTIVSRRNNVTNFWKFVVIDKISKSPNLYKEIIFTFLQPKNV